jgi:hypothetical protein
VHGVIPAWARSLRQIRTERGDGERPRGPVASPDFARRHCPAASWPLHLISRSPDRWERGKPSGTARGSWYQPRTPSRTHGAAERERTEESPVRSSRCAQRILPLVRDGQPFPTLGPAALQHDAAVLRRHSNQESVGLGAPTGVWLISTFALHRSLEKVVPDAPSVG